MGTNYYWHQNIEIDGCECEMEVVRHHLVSHVGKSSAGWSFCFRVRNVTEDAPAHTPRDSEGWRRLMAEFDGVLIDEYGQIHDVEDFWRRVDAPERKAMLDCMKADGRAPSDFDFRDAYGHRCSRVDFS